MPTEQMLGQARSIAAVESIGTSIAENYRSKLFGPTALTRESRSQQFGPIILSKEEIIRMLPDGRNAGLIRFSPSSGVVMTPILGKQVGWPTGG